MRQGLHRYSVGPERPDWYRVDGVGWVYGTSADVRRYDQPVNIDDTAAREWQRRGASLDLPVPTFARPDFRWRLHRADGTILEFDPEKRE